VTLHVAADAVRERFGPQWGTFVRVDDETCEYRTGDDDLDWLALRVAMLGVDFEVHEPPELVEHVRVVARRLRRAARSR
jgi:predicted DNA-binding transcriptional regulator YafY